MPASKAQQKAVNKYMKENYDRFLLTLKPKGRLDVIKAHATAQGESTSAFINRAIDHQISQDRRKGPSEAQQGLPGGSVVSLPSEAYKCAVDASEAAGEGLPDFVARAVTIQAQRDETARKLGGVHGN